MKKIIQIEGENIYIGTETGEIINTTLTSIDFENPKVGDEVEVYNHGEDVLVVKAESGSEKTNTIEKAENTKKITTKESGKTKWIIIAGIIIALVVIRFVACGERTETYEWPDSALANMLPEPEGKITSVSESDGEYLDANVEIEDDYCKVYIEACKEKGFTEVIDSSARDGDYDYTAKNDEGWQLTVYNWDDDMSISLKSPEWLDEQEKMQEEAEKESSSDEEETSDSGNDSDESALVDGMRPEFKEAMDSYEDFYDEYCDFMNEYAEDPTNMELISKYSDLVSQATEVDSKFSAWDDGTLNDAELDYYLEVSGRVADKLLDVAV